MNHKASKPEKKDIARPIKTSTRVTTTTTIGHRASSRKGSKAQVPYPIEEEPENDKRPEEEEDGMKQHGEDGPEDEPMKKPNSRKTKTKSAKKSRFSAKTADIPEAEDEPEDETATKTKVNATNKSSAKASQVSEDEEIRYFHRVYVDAHKDTEDFHHRGAGRWASGLPHPEANFKTACVGPGAKAWKAEHKDGEK